MSGITDLLETYLDRCVSACNLYVDTFNENMKDLIDQKIAEPLDESFKADRFKSMTGENWQEGYNGYKRSRTDNKQSLNEWVQAKGCEI